MTYATKRQDKMFKICLIIALSIHVILLCCTAIKSRQANKLNAQSIDVVLLANNNLLKDENSNLSSTENNFGKSMHIFKSVAQAEQASAQSPTGQQKKSIPQKIPQAATAVSTNKEMHANYIAALQTYLEDFGNQHYANVLKKKNITGRLQLLVAIDAKGQLKTLRLVQTSGNTELDELAQTLVKQAAPFKPFPQDMANNIDTLEFVRTWNFQG